MVTQETPGGGCGGGAAGSAAGSAGAATSSPSSGSNWAVGLGASENVFSARSAFANAVNAYGGKLNKTNAAQIYLSFYNERMARAQEKLAQPADVSDVTEEEGAALWA